MAPRFISKGKLCIGILIAIAFVIVGCSSKPEPATSQPPASAPPASTPPASTPPASTQPPASTPPASTPPASTAPSAKPAPGNKIAIIQTSMGTIKVELLANEAPKTAENFKALAQQGRYDGTIFHRVISGFMIQGGDPHGDGKGGQTATGRPLPNEVNPGSPVYQGGYKRGIVAMANQQGRPETGTSQFFIMHKDTALPPQYTVFGRVIEGMEVVDKIAAAPNGGAPDNRPLDPVKMNKVSIQ